MRVDVQSRRRPGVGEAAGHDRDRDTCVEHFGRHEVTEIVQSEVRKSCLGATPDECLRHPVRTPREHPVRLEREDEPICPFGRRRRCRYSLQLSLERFDGRCIERDPVRTPGLRRSKNWPVDSLGEGSLKCQTPLFQIDVLPSQGEQLSPSGAGGCREEEKEAEGWIGIRRVGDDVGDFAGNRWSKLRRYIGRRARMACGVQPDPLPPDSLSQCPMQDDVHPVDSARRRAGGSFGRCTGGGRHRSHRCPSS